MLKHLPEEQRSIGGLRSFAGFRQIGLPYERAAREGGRAQVFATGPGILGSQWPDRLQQLPLKFGHVTRVSPPFAWR